MAIIAVNYKGETKEFNVVENTDIKDKNKFGVKIYTLDGIPCYSVNGVHWADKDTLESTIVNNMDQILENIDKKKDYFRKVA